MIVYKIYNTKNRKSLIGKTTQSLKRRMIQHRCELRRGTHANKHLQDSWNKYGESYFVFEIIEEVKTNKENDLNECEKKWIKYLKTRNRLFGYNMSDGGEGQSGWIPSKKWRDKKSKSMIGKKLPPFTEEHRKRISEARVGIKISDETKEKLRTHYYKNKEKIDKQLENGRKKLSREKLMQTYSKMRNKLNELEKCPEYMARKKEAVRKSCGVKIVDQFGNTYSTIKDAALKIGAMRQNISKQLRGKCKSNKGFVFRKLLEDEGE